MKSRSAESIYTALRGDKDSSEPSAADKLSGINLAVVITDEPKVTLLIKGDTIPLPLDYFVVPDWLKFNKDEVLLAYPLSGVDAINKRFAIKPLHEPMMLGTHVPNGYTIDGTNIFLPEEEVFCPYPVVDNVTKCYITGNRFPDLPGYPNTYKRWVVVNIW